MRRQRSLVTALVLAAVGVATLSVSSAVAVVSDQVPVTQDENITLWAGTMHAPMNLLANDSDPEGERLQICRFGDPQPDWQLFVDPVDFRRGGRVQVTLEPTATGVYTYEYRVCDHSYLVPGHLDRQRATSGDDNRREGAGPPAPPARDQPRRALRLLLLVSAQHRRTARLRGGRLRRLAVDPGRRSPDRLGVRVHRWRLRSAHRVRDRRRSDRVSPTTVCPHPRKGPRHVDGRTRA